MSPTEKNALHAHPRDITAENLQLALSRHPRPELLIHLIKLSRGAFGFFPNQLSYTRAYPWAAERLMNLSASARVLDAGAGLSPLPLFLAEKGAVVDCLDNSRHLRRPPSTPQWNEWGFFDYRPLHPNLTSHHLDINDFAPTERYDVIYSLMTLAHMPRATREETLSRFWEWMLPEALLLLAIDLIPATDFVWNRSEGREVEPLFKHGALDTVTRRLVELGFRLEECTLWRTIPKSRTDVLFLSARKVSPSIIAELDADSPGC